MIRVTPGFEVDGTWCKSFFNESATDDAEELKAGEKATAVFQVFPGFLLDSTYMHADVLYQKSALPEGISYSNW